MPKSSVTLRSSAFTAAVVAGVLVCAGAPAASRAAAAAPAAGSAQADDGPEGVINYTRVDATVACAGATPPEAMAVLKARGFAAVVNFRTAGERGASVDAGKTAAEAAGLKYFHLPFRQPSAQIVETFLDTVSEPSNQPVYIHCGSANRVGALWLIKRVKLDGWAVDRALAEAEAIGLRSKALREFALDYVNSPC